MNPGGDNGRRGDRRVALSLLATPLIFALVLFLPAGTWAWRDGWVFILVFLSAGTAAGLYVVRVNPEILTARSRVHEGTKGWDRILLGFLIPTMMAIFPVAALDAGRFHWSPVPWWPACSASPAAGRDRAHRLGSGREQVLRAGRPHPDGPGPRGHRHRPLRRRASPRLRRRLPAFRGHRPVVGLLWALVPAGLASLLLIVRTRWEDRTLQAELAGYEGYTQRVRSRWIPGVW